MCLDWVTLPLTSRIELVLGLWLGIVLQLGLEIMLGLC